MNEEKKKIINRHGEKSDFKPSMIRDSLREETNLDEQEIHNAVQRVSTQIKKMDKNEFFTSEIRELVKTSLLRNKEEEGAEEYDTISVASSEIDNLLNNGCSDNANMDKTPETVHKYVADMVFKQYNLKKMPKRIRDAHVDGFIKIHDLEYLEERGNNCCQHDIRYFIKNGVKLDGTGKHTTVANPARNITSLINHLGQILNVAQSTMAGGQGIAYGNIFLAPYAKGLSYKEIKNAMQAFIFNLNMSYTSRGGQPVFSSVNVELGVPSFLKDEPAYGPGGIVRGVYGDYEEEAELILRALLEVIEEGDGAGKNHLFPNLIISLRDEFMNKEDLLFRCCETVSKVPTPYFSNCDLNGESMSKALMGCRTSSWNNYTGEWDTDVLRCANLGFVTINLPRIAYIAKDSKDFKKILRKYLDITRDALLYQESILERNLYENKNLNFLTQINDDTGEYYKYKNSSLSIGFNGLNEALMNLGYDELDTDAGHLLGLGIVKYINNYCKEQKKQDGRRWACFATPAESTSWQFATKDLKDFPDIKHKGTKDAPFYTNSSHCPVDSGIDILDKIKYEAEFHPLTLAGNICHLFLGSKICPNVLMDLVKYCKDAGLLFWAFTNDYHYCFDCSTMANGLSEVCNECNSDNVENYSRITGYYQKIDLKDPNQGWNKGKKEELKERRRYEL